MRAEDRTWTTPSLSTKSEVRVGAQDRAIKAAIASFEPPARIGPIRIQRTVGAGAMGVVCAGFDESLQRRVAVKFLVSHRYADADVETFLEGARAAAQGQHPNLTTIYSADVYEQVPYLVMEFVDGPTLTQVLRDAGALDRAVIHSILLQVSAGVAALHRVGVIHRDIKPDNVMLDLSGTLKLTDFGLCLRTENVHRIPFPTACTPAFAAPEVRRGLPSMKADIFAIGVIAARLTADSGHAPDGDLADVIRQSTHPRAYRRFRSAISLHERLSIVAAETPPANLSTLLEDGGDVTPSMALATDTDSYPESVAKWAALRRARRQDTESTSRLLQPTNHCAKCYYPVFGDAEIDACPECGHSVSASLAVATTMATHPIALTRLRQCLRHLLAVLAIVLIASLGFASSESRNALVLYGYEISTVGYALACWVLPLLSLGLMMQCHCALATAVGRRAYVHRLALAIATSIVLFDVWQALYQRSWLWIVSVFLGDLPFPPHTGVGLVLAIFALLTQAWQDVPRLGIYFNKWCFSAQVLLMLAALVPLLMRANDLLYLYYDIPVYHWLLFAVLITSLLSLMQLLRRVTQICQHHGHSATDARWRWSYAAVVVAFLFFHLVLLLRMFVFD